MAPVRATVVPLLMLALGGTLLGVGLPAVTRSDVAAAGPVQMHVDDADTVTLAALPWVRLTEGWLFLFRQARFCDGGKCFHAVPLASRQLLRDCLGRDEAAAGPGCSQVRLAVLVDDVQWRGIESAAQGQPGVHWDVSGTVVPSGSLPTAAWKALQEQGLPPAPRVLLALDAEPAPTPPARLQVLLGALLVFGGALLTAWVQRRSHA